DITLNSTLNVEPLKGEKLKLKVGGALREQLEIGVNLSGPVDMDLRAQTRWPHQQVQHFLRQQQPDNQAVILNLLLIQQ
ncbi:hypothetical protein AAIH53_34080, partial [Pseudomonas aeruginosa]